MSSPASEEHQYQTQSPLQHLESTKDKPINISPVEGGEDEYGVTAKPEPIALAVNSYYVGPIDFQHTPEVAVYDTTGNQVYKVSDHIGEEKIKHGVVVTNLKGKEILRVSDKHSAWCGFRYTYHDSIGTRYQIRPRGPLTDHWSVFVKDEKKELEFTYTRKSTSIGGVLYGPSGKVAEIGWKKSWMDSSPSWTYQKYSSADFIGIDLKNQDLQPYLYVAFLALLQKRIDRCGS